MIFGPDGRPLAEPLPEDAEGLVCADIDLGMISIAKSAADPVGHYPRPDVTRLLLNTASNPPVEYFHLPMHESQPVMVRDEAPLAEVEQVAEPGDAKRG